MSCAKPVHKTINIQIPKFEPYFQISEDHLSATIITNTHFADYDSLSLIAGNIVSVKKLIILADSTVHDSSAIMFAPLVNDLLPDIKRTRKINSIALKNNLVEIAFLLDTTVISPLIRNTIAKYDSKKPINPLFDRNGNIPNFNQLSPSSSLTLPCDKLNVPTRASRLPNAPRSYRSGIHRGIDFFSNWGTPVRSVANGVVIRSDLGYKEIDADFRVQMLSEAANLKRTPSDIFNELLLGQAVIIDHGFELFSGFRTITIYAHLSHINANIKPGYEIKQGEIFAKSGNTGTKPSTLGTRDESHLHWELILQDKEGEYYFGQGLKYNELSNALNKLFK
jgi:murein DD-endopeptidase MepM/ murein hydrolase activator NlpD